MSHVLGGGGRGAVAFTPGAMEDVAADVEVQGDLLDDTAADVGAALDAFLASSSEYVPSIPAHEAAIATHAELLRGLATSVLHLAAAAREADERGFDLWAFLATGVDWTRRVGGANSQREAVVALLQLSGHGARHVRASVESLRLTARYGPRAMPAIEAIRREVAGGVSMSRQAIRGHQLARYRELKDTRTALARTQRNAAAAIRAVPAGSPLTRIGTRVGDLMTTTRGGQALRSAGRGLGFAGVAIGAWDTVDDVVEGDYENAVVSGLGTAGSIMLMSGNPVVMGAGAVITVGVVVYDNWDTITDFGGDVVDGLADFGGGIVDGASDIFGLF